MYSSLLRYGFAIPSDFKRLSTRFVSGRIIFVIRRPVAKCRCSICKGDNVKPRGTKTRVMRVAPIGTKRVELEVVINRLECLDCGVIRQEHLSFADPRRSYTHAFERTVLELSKRMTIQDVASYLDVSWDIVKDIQKRYLNKMFGRPKLKHLEYLAIDEIFIGGRSRCFTIVMDLIEGAVVYVGEGRSAESLEPFWRRLRRFKSHIKAVAMDMAPAYINAVQKNLPGAQIVFDHFHVIKLFNERLTQLRRALYHEVKDVMQKNVLKGARWLLLKNPENLEDNRNEKQRLQEALKLNEPLAIAYYLKEDLRQLWYQENILKAADFLTDWIAKAQASGVLILRKFAATLAAYRTGILAYYNHPISTAPLEGTNNKIKTLNRQAYGFRDLEFFKLKIYGLHEKKYALVG